MEDDTYLAVAVSMVAVRQNPPVLYSEDGNTVTFGDTGVSARSHVTLIGFNKPLTRDEITKEALEQCHKNYPPTEGWADHQVSTAPFDPEKFFEMVKLSQQ